MPDSDGPVPTAAIRLATPRDLEALVQMFAWLFEPPGYPPAQWDPARAREALEEAIAGDQSAILVAECEDGELVGLASAYLDLRSVRYGLRCWVEDLVVDPARRSTGIGKALLDAAKAWARERGATHLELDTGLARSDAQRFYDRERPAAKGYSYSWSL